MPPSSPTQTRHVAANPAPGGGSSYAGFEYQFLASVWLALKLIFDRQLCTEITIEPSSQEDVAAVLAGTVDPDDTATVLGAPLAAFPVDIQVKRRSAAWTEATFRAILQGDGASQGTRGPAPRTRPLDALKGNPKLHFVLLTNAQLSADLSDFVVREVGATSAATELPVKPAVDGASAIAPRIGILGEHTPNELALDIDRLVRRYGHVPESKVADCRAHLLDDVRLRVLGEAPPQWRRADIEKVFLANAGRFDEGEGFVVPVVFATLARQLEERHRLLLTGGPGVGKTELAHELARRLQISPETFEVVSGKAGIQAVREALRAPGSHLFLIEDPWGHDRLTDEAGSWANELPKFFAKAGPTKRFLVTSRAGVRHEAFGNQPIPGFTDTEFELRPEHFSPDDRREIMRLQMLEAKPWQRDWVDRHEAEWLKRLDRPLTIGHFASRVTQAQVDSELEIEEVMRISDVDALAGILSGEIRRRGTAAVAASLLIWSIHRADEHVSIESVRHARDVARAGGFAGDFDPEQTLEGFRHAGWFRSLGERFVAHPTALTGIESLLASHGGTADDILGGFLKGLVDAGQTPRAFAVVRHLELRPSAASRRVREAVEKQLMSDFLAAHGYDAERAFTHLVEHAISTAPAIRFLQALRPKRGHGPLASVEFWKPPKLSPEEQNLISNSSEARTVARKFVIDVLPNDTWLRYGADDLIPFLQSFGWSFESEFTTAALDALTQYDRSARLDFLIEAAVLSGTRDFIGLTDGVLVADEIATRAWEENAGDRAKAEQAELDGEYSSHLEEEGSELFSPIRRATELAVGARRRAEGWHWLLTHPRASELRWAWAASIDGGAQQDEIDALASLSADKPSIIWEAIANTANQAQVPAMLSGVSTVPVADIAKWCKAIARLASDVSWRGQVLPALRQLPLSQRMALAVLDSRTEEGSEKLEQLTTLLSSNEREIRDICDNVSEGKSWNGKVSPAHRTQLRELASHGNTRFKRAAVIALAALKEDVTAFTTELASSDDEEARRTALFARFLVGVDVPQHVLHALQDRDYRVRRLGLQLGAEAPTPEFIARLLEMADDRSAPVREKCAGLIGKLADPLGLPVLVRLLQDRRDRRGSKFTNQSWPEFHVARAAAEALANFSLDAPTIEACLEFLNAPVGEDQTDDVTVHYLLMEALGSADDDRLIPFFSAALDNGWHIIGQQESGYPLRRMAAICLAMQLEQFPERAPLVDLARLVIAGSHDDPLFAGPALVALGLCGRRATSEIVQVSRSIATTPDRAILLEAALDDGTATARTELQKVSGKSHAARIWLDLPFDQIPAPPEWPAWRDRNPEFKTWLAGIQGSGGVNAWLRYALGKRFGQDAPEEFSSRDKLEGLLPKPIGILSLRGMFGGE